MVHPTASLVSITSATAANSGTRELKRAEKMLHRHLNHEGFTLAAIDDVILRGRWDDWVKLRAAMLNERSIHQKVERLCNAHGDDPYAQRYHFWRHYAKQHQPAS